LVAGRGYYQWRIVKWRDANCSVSGEKLPRKLDSE
jgi:hypothetical protein